jgi:hypothetical protein
VSHPFRNDELVSQSAAQRGAEIEARAATRARWVTIARWAGFAVAMGFVAYSTIVLLGGLLWVVAVIIFFPGR